MFTDRLVEGQVGAMSFADFFRGTQVFFSSGLEAYFFKLAYVFKIDTLSEPRLGADASDPV